MTGPILAHPTRVENRTRRLRAAAALALVALLAGCATVPPDAGQDPRDPLESFNRQVFAFNEGLDKVVLKPLAQAYDRVLPQGVQDCIANGFSNLREPSNALNNLLQGKGAAAVNDVCRFTVNTTVGLLGCFDVASRMGLEKHREDFGQTLAVWGVGSGPYLVLPLFGPSSFRDGAGLGVESVLDVNFWIENVRVRNSLFALRTVQARDELLPADDLIRGAALDKYTFIRDGYLQRRRSLVYDGAAPRDRLPQYEDEGDEPAPKEGPGQGSPGAPTDPSGVKPASGPASSR